MDEEPSGLSDSIEEASVFVSLPLLPCDSFLFLSFHLFSLCIIFITIPSSHLPPPPPPPQDRAGGDRLFASPGRHKVVLHVDKKRPLGFSIRGGKEYSLGLYISQ